MTDTFTVLADTISEECGVPRDKITLDSHVVDDLGIDSIGFLDLCYALDTKLDIKIPFEQWVNDINSGKIKSDKHFIMRNLAIEIDKIIAAGKSNPSS